jgi:hypothetical protein
VRDLHEAFATTEPISLQAGPYMVAIDASEMTADEEVPLRISIRRDGEPAGDLEPYLGVAAHAVLIRAEDLRYVHAHPTDDAADGDAHGHGQAPAPEPPPPPASHAATEHAEGHTEPPGGSVAPDMVLQLTPPGPGRYSFFLEFIGGGEVRTLSVPLLVPG